MTETEDVDTLAREPGSPPNAMDSPDRDEAKESSTADDDPSPGDSLGPNDDPASSGGDASPPPRDQHDAEDMVRVSWLGWCMVSSCCMAEKCVLKCLHCHSCFLFVHYPCL